MRNNVLEHFEYLLVRYPVLNKTRNEILEVYKTIEYCYKNNGKVLFAGNGGSAADADHIVGELMKGFKKKRTLLDNTKQAFISIDPERGNYLSKKLQGALPALSLSSHVALNTAFSNDIDGKLAFAQQVIGYGRTGDVFFGISTSGNSENIIDAAIVAKAIGMKVVVLSGKDGGILKRFADVEIIVPKDETYEIQELHLPIYHTLCLMLEERFFE